MQLQNFPSHIKKKKKRGRRVNKTSITNQVKTFSVDDMANHTIDHLYTL